MGPVASVTSMPSHEAAESSVSPGPSEPVFQVAVSEEVGAESPQLAPAERSVPVAALVTTAPWDDGAIARARAKGRNRVLL